jgi:hypothetical protein
MLVFWKFPNNHPCHPFYHILGGGRIRKKGRPALVFEAGQEIHIEGYRGFFGSGSVRDDSGAADGIFQGKQRRKEGQKTVTFFLINRRQELRFNLCSF